jgi:DNA invertase Pin-like site-specific DNA recombinase
MNVGYLHSAASVDELKGELAAFEQIGCERIVVDNTQSLESRGETLRALVERLGAGDTLVVNSMADIACSMPELVNLILELDEQGVRFRSLTERFDTGSKHRVILKALLGQLREFQELLIRRQETSARVVRRRRVGRPNSLSQEAADQARALIKQGHGIDEVAQQFRISRATLYRYLGDAVRSPAPRSC